MMMNGGNNDDTFHFMSYSMPCCRQLFAIFHTFQHIFHKNRKASEINCIRILGMTLILWLQKEMATGNSELYFRYRFRRYFIEDKFSIYWFSKVIQKRYPHTHTYPHREPQPDHQTHTDTQTPTHTQTDPATHIDRETDTQTHIHTPTVTTRCGSFTSRSVK